MPGKAITRFNNRLPSDDLRCLDGSLIKKKDPERYACLLRAIQEGFTKESIARIFKTDPKVIEGITKHEGLDQHNQAGIIEELKATRNLAVSKLKKALTNDELKGRELGVVVGILTDKEAQLSGMPSATVRHIKEDHTFDAIQALVKQAPKKVDVIDTEIVEEKVRPVKQSKASDV